MRGNYNIIFPILGVILTFPCGRSFAPVFHLSHHCFVSKSDSSPIWNFSKDHSKCNGIQNSLYSKNILGVSIGAGGGNNDLLTLDSNLQELKSYVESDVFSSTSRGLNVKDEEERKNIDKLIRQVESLCPLEEPARNPRMGGKWIVDYTTAPPPSNGKLGPFLGVARQEIDLTTKTYINYLSVPGDDLSKEWLSAKLIADYEEWDGNLLMDQKESKDIQPVDQMKENESAHRNEDYGATSWKVNFQTLTIKLFGLTLFTQNLQGKSRVWKMTYLDDESRIVRAGKTGLDEDDWVFYMSREP